MTRRKRTFTTPDEIREAIKDKRTKITDFSMELKAHPAPDAPLTDEAFTLSADTLRDLLRHKTQMNANHIRLTQTNCKKLMGCTLVIVIRDAKYYSGWRGRVKRALTWLRVLED